MRVVVTGADGYIGAMLVPHLLAAGYEVTACDPKWFGSGHLPDNPNLKKVRVDIRDNDLSWLDGEVLIHLAGIPRNGMCEEQPKFTKSVNVFGTIRILEYAANKGMRVIYPSSVAVYGNTEEPAKEDHPLNPSTAYGEQKVMVEEFVRTLPAYVITRAATVSGYSMNMLFHTTVHAMVRDAYKKGMIRVNGGQQKRCHVNLHDVCKAYLAILKEQKNGAFNIVQANETVLDTAHSVMAVMDEGVKLEVGEATDNRSYMADGSAITRAFDFFAERNTAQSAGEVYARFKSGMWADPYTDKYERTSQRRI